MADQQPSQQPGGSQPPSQEPRQQLQPHWIWLILLGLLAAYWMTADFGPARNEISYTRFKEVVRQDRVAEVTIKGDQVAGQFKQAEAPDAQGRPGALRRFVTTKPAVEDTELLPLLEKHDVTIHAESTEAAWWARALIGILPWILLIGLIFYASKKMQERMAGGAGGGLFGFGKSKAKRFHKEEATKVAFDDVAGADNAKKDMQEIVGFLKDPERYRALGAKIPRGVLLSGPPGTGKTLLAKAIAGEADVPFYSISGSEFVEMFVGVGASRVRDMFDQAKQESPAIIFVDELDAIGRTRGAGVGGGHDEREQTLNQILAEMDGFEPHETVVVLAATNRPDVLDPALLRPGRFDRKVTLERPQRDARRRILQVHTRKVPLAEDVNLDTLAGRTIGFSGADLENLVNEAALLAAREKSQKVGMDAFDKARDKIVLGARRDEMLGEEDRRLIAYHEGGHAILAWLLPHADPLDKVTIIPRGQALGATEQTPEEEPVNLKESYLKDRITGMLGGRAAEQIIFGEVTTGAQQDLKQATQLARRMIAQWGMNEKLGGVYFERGEEHIFLGRELGEQRNFSERTAEMIDEEIRSLLGDLEERARKLIKDNRRKLDALVDALMERETLQADEVRRLFEQLESGAQGTGPASAAGEA